MAQLNSKPYNRPTTTTTFTTITTITITIITKVWLTESISLLFELTLMNLMALTLAN